MSKSRAIRARICACTLFIAVIAYILIGYYLDEWRWSLFVFAIVPLMPFALGLKRIHISYELVVVVAYLTLGFTIGDWHPWWVLFLTIPVYHILFDHPVVELHKDKKKEDDKTIEVDWEEK